MTLILTLLVVGVIAWGAWHDAQPDAALENAWTSLLTELLSA